MVASLVASRLARFRWSCVRWSRAWSSARAFCRGRDSRQDGILANLQFGQLNIGLRLQQRVAVFFLVRVALGFGLDDVLLGLRHIGLGFAEFVVLLGGIELHDDIALFHRLTGGPQVGDVHVGAAGLRRGQELRVAAAEIASRGDDQS